MNTIIILSNKSNLKVFELVKLITSLTSRELLCWIHWDKMFTSNRNPPYWFDFLWLAIPPSFDLNMSKVFWIFSFSKKKVELLTNLSSITHVAPKFLAAWTAITLHEGPASNLKSSLICEYCSLQWLSHILTHLNCVK